MACILQQKLQEEAHARQITDLSRHSDGRLRDDRRLRTRRAAGAARVDRDGDDSTDQRADDRHRLAAFG